MDTRWIIYLDLDGTLLNSQLQVSGRVRRALRDLPPDVEVVLASGRPAASCRRLAEELLADPLYLIASNGGAIIDCAKGKPIHHACFSEETVGTVAAFAESRPVTLCVYHPTQWYADGRGTALATRSGSKPTYVANLEEFYAGAVKLLMVGDPDVIRDLQPLVSATEGVTAFVSYPDYLEVMPAAVSKAAAAKLVASRLETGAPFREMAVGDGLGDVPLLQAVDCSVAVANAVPEAKRAAHYISPSNNDDGVAVTIDALVRGEPEAMRLLDAGGRTR
jgi:Cof subfamily protein (haloacid dehalogenase superfamily)